MPRRRETPPLSGNHQDVRLVVPRTADAAAEVLQVEVEVLLVVLLLRHAAAKVLRFLQLLQVASDPPRHCAAGRRGHPGGKPNALNAVTRIEPPKVVGCCGWSHSR